MIMEIKNRGISCAQKICGDDKIEKKRMEIIIFQIIIILVDMWKQKPLNRIIIKLIIMI
jgi:hypothetical protein